MNNSLQVAIDKVKEQFVKAYQARNAGKIADLYSSGGILYPANGANVAGRSSIKSYYEKGFVRGASDFVFESKDLYQGLSNLWLQKLVTIILGLKLRSQATILSFGG